MMLVCYCIRIQSRLLVYGTVRSVQNQIFLKVYLLFSTRDYIANSHSVFDSMSILLSVTYVTLVTICRPLDSMKHRLKKRFIWNCEKGTET